MQTGVTQAKDADVSRNKQARVPDARLRFNPLAGGMREYPRSFFHQSTKTVAQELIGAWLARHWEGVWYGARIVETEAYLGSTDPAAHTWRGRRTKRVEPMYRDGGHLYVFFVYGMHNCANVVTQPEGIGEAVLLRAAEGPPGAPPALLSGPALLCRGLGISTEVSGSDLLAGGSIRLFCRMGRRPLIGVSSRVGVDYAGEARDWPLRFFDLDSPSVSRIRLNPNGV